jgi:hypothetical protein
MKDSNSGSHTPGAYFSRLTGLRAITEVDLLEPAAEAYDRMTNGGARFRVVLNTGQPRSVQLTTGF